MTSPGKPAARPGTPLWKPDRLAAQRHTRRRNGTGVSPGPETARQGDRVSVFTRAVFYEP